MRAPMTRGRSVRAVFAPDKCGLSVTNAFGAAWPANGTASLDKGSTVSAWSAGLVEDGRAQYVCTGWSGSGSVPASGTGTNATFSILEDSALAWVWRTNYLVRVAVVGDGTVDFTEGWVAAGSDILVTAAPGDTAYTSDVWSGDIDGAVADGFSISLCVDSPKDLTITFAALGIGDAVDRPSFVWSTDGDTPWIPVNDGAHDGTDAAMAAASGGGEYAESSLRATFLGPGELSFWWKVAAASGGAGIDLVVDGEYAENVWLSGASDWTNASVTLGDGDHVVEWVFWSDGTDSLASGWLDEVSFPGGLSPETIEIGDVSVPVSWVETAAAEILASQGGNPTNALKATAANGRPVWECYVADLDPTEADDDLKVTIAMKPDGTPELSILSGESPDRVYETQGAPELGGPWGEVTEESRFFRMKVRLPEP